MRVSKLFSSVMALGVFVGGVAACGGSSSAKGSGGSSTTSSTSTASGTSGSSGSSGATFPFPQVSFGTGPLIATPKIVTITFPGDVNEAALASFGEGVTSSSWWSTVTSGLCGTGSTCMKAGTGSSAVATSLPSTSYVDYPGNGTPSGSPTNTMQPYLQSLIGALPANQQPDAETLYVVYFPATTSISLEGQESCTVFGGYHNSMTMGSQTVAYAVIPECSLSSTSKLTTELEQTTFAASHEILEGTTDPDIPSGASLPTGYYVNENLQNSLGWLTLGDGELADLCVDQLGFGQDETTEGGFSVQRIWSIANAAAGNADPCVPSSGKTYFNAFPTVSAVIVSAVGASTTFEVDALALGTEPEWTVALEDVTDKTLQTSYVSFSIAGGTSTNNIALAPATSGDKLSVTVTMTKDPSTAADSPGWATAIVVSLNGTNPSAATSGNVWPFIVLTEAQAKADGITMAEHVSPRVIERMRERTGGRGRSPRLPRTVLDQLLGIKLR